MDSDTSSKNLVVAGLEQPEFLVDKAHDAIQSAILRNELKPGTLISEGALSKQLGISRTPIREALKRLQEHGFVRIMPHRGAFITNVSAENIVEMYQLREALECYAIQFVPQYGDPAELEKLVGDFEQSAKWVETGDVDKVNDADTRLHRYIASASRNRPLIKLVDQLLGQVTRLRAMTPTVPGRLATQVQEHLRIVYALKAANVEEARRALRDHLQTVRDTALQFRLRVQ